MIGQPLYSELHYFRSDEDPACVRALQGHSEVNSDITQLSHHKIEKEYAKFLCHLGSSRNEGSLKFGGLVTGGFGRSEGLVAVYFTLALTKNLVFM